MLAYADAAAQGMLAAAAKEAVLAAELYNNAADTGYSALAQFTLGSLLLRCGEVRQYLYFCASKASNLSALAQFTLGSQLLRCGERIRQAVPSALF